ncbi:hypothetical protein Tco_1165745 [Tanacetum coccineum]
MALCSIGVVYVVHSMALYSIGGVYVVRSMALCSIGGVLSYAFSDSLLLTPLCGDDIHDVTPPVSALAGINDAIKVTLFYVINHSTTLLEIIKFEVLTAIKEYLGISLGDALHKVLQRHTAEFIKEHSVLADVVEVLKQKQKPQKSAAYIRKINMEHAAKQQESQYTIKSSNKAALNEFDQKQALFETMTSSKSFNNHPKHMALYHALMESILADEDAMDQGPVYNLLKGTCKSCVELEYNMKECYKALNDQLDWNNSKGDRCPFDLSKPLPLVKSQGTSHWGPKQQSFYGYATNRVSKNDVYSTKRIMAVTNVKVNKWYGYGHLEEIESRRVDQQLYKFMEGDFPRLHLNDIEDMLLLVVQNKLFNLKGDVIVDLAVALHMFTRHLSRSAPYTTLSDPQGVIYEDKLDRKRLMPSDELRKFSDGTLQSIQDTLHDMEHNLRMGYNKVMPRRKWSNLDKKWSQIMVKDID